MTTDTSDLNEIGRKTNRHARRRAQGLAPEPDREPDQVSRLQARWGIGKKAAERVAQKAEERETIEALVDALADAYGVGIEEAARALASVSDELAAKVDHLLPDEPTPEPGQKTGGGDADTDELLDDVLESAAETARELDQPATNDKGEIVEPFKTKRPDVDDIGRRKRRSPGPSRSTERAVRKEIESIDAVEPVNWKPTETEADEGEPDAPSWADEVAGEPEDGW